jgi:hypothetical protein
MKRQTKNSRRVVWKLQNMTILFETALIHHQAVSVPVWTGNIRIEGEYDSINKSFQDPFVASIPLGICKYTRHDPTAFHAMTEVLSRQGKSNYLNGRHRPVGRSRRREHEIVESKFNNSESMRHFEICFRIQRTST